MVVLNLHSVNLAAMVLQHAPQSNVSEILSPQWTCRFSSFDINQTTAYKAKQHTALTLCSLLIFRWRFQLLWLSWRQNSTRVWARWKLFTFTSSLHQYVVSLCVKIASVLKRQRCRDTTQHRYNMQFSISECVCECERKPRKREREFSTVHFMVLTINKLSLFFHFELMLMNVLKVQTTLCFTVMVVLIYSIYHLL